MDVKPFQRIFVSRPTDKSLEAYKSWIKDLAKQLAAGDAEVILEDRADIPINAIHMYSGLKADLSISGAGRERALRMV